MDKQSLQEIATSEPERAIDAALEALDDSDRNVRVSAIRILGSGDGSKGVDGMIAGLRDSKRRVRETAIKNSRPYLNDPRIVARLQEIVEDENEKSKIRGEALRALGGHFPQQGGVYSVPKAAMSALQAMAQAEDLRSDVLWRLLQMELTDDVEALLREFVKKGTREEAVMATRALCGFKVVNIGLFDKAERKRIIQNNEPAAGRVFYWIKRSAG